jgi:hypothetical protein
MQENNFGSTGLTSSLQELSDMLVNELVVLIVRSTTGCLVVSN